MGVEIIMRTKPMSAERFNRLGGKKKFSRYMNRERALHAAGKKKVIYQTPSGMYAVRKGRM
jgi:hypothetical protein